MATTKATGSKQSQQSQIKPGTPEMEVALQAGYPDMTVEKAKTIIAERKTNPAMWPYEVFERAQAFLAAYNTAPVAIDTDPHWTRRSNSK